MTETSVRKLGPYVLGERSARGGSGEWFTASDPALERPVSVLVVPLPEDQEAAAAMRERARRVAAVDDARLLPVYGQGEEGAVLWLAIRQVAGQPLSEVASLATERAARLGSQAAGQLIAMEEAGIAPTRVVADDLVVEGAGGRERVWLLPSLERPGDDVSTATQSLIELLDERAGRPLLDDPSPEPRTLADQLARLVPERRRRGRLAVGVGAAVVLAILAAVLVVVLARDSDPSDPADAQAPAARVAARIPLGERATALAAGQGTVWAATTSGALVRVDTETQSVVGAPLELFPKEAYVDLAADGDALWAGGPGLLLRLDSSTGRVLERKRLGSRAVSGVLPDGATLWLTATNGPSPIAELVRLDRKTGREVSLGVAGGFAIPALAEEGSVWALGGDASLRRLTPRRPSTTIGLAGQAGFPAVYERRLWVPTRGDRTVVAIDPLRMSVERTVRFDAEPIDAEAGAGSIWVLTDRPSQIHRVDPETGAFLGAPLAAPRGARTLEFGGGSLWVDDPNRRTLVRLEPATPAPAPRPARPADDVLRSGPVPQNVRLRVTTVGPNFSLRVADDSWLAQGVAGAGLLELFRYRRPGPDAVGLNFAVTRQAFDRAGRLVPVRSPGEFLRVLRQNPSLRIETVAPATLGSRRGLRVRFRTVPKPPFPEFCRGMPCVLLFPQDRGTFVLLPGTEEFTIVKQGRGVFLVDATFGDRKDPRIARQIDRLLDSIRFAR